MADGKVYSGVTESGLQSLRQNLQEMGITAPEGNSGTITYQGVKLAIDYAPADQNLSIRILEKPSFIPGSLIWQMLDARVQKCIEG
ncbi:MAG: hypothetical protein ACRD2P_08810 [Terriglobia bacterium]